MDISKMLAELRSERQESRGSGKRRGRPPKWMSEAKGQESASTGNTKKRVPGKQ